MGFFKSLNTSKFSFYSFRVLSIAQTGRNLVIAPAGSEQSFLASCIWFHNPSFFTNLSLVFEEASCQNPLCCVVALGSRDSTNMFEMFLEALLARTKDWSYLKRKHSDFCLSSRTRSWCCRPFWQE